MEQVALKTILFFSVIFLIVTFLTSTIKKNKIIDQVGVLHCLFYCTIIILSMNGLNIIAD